MTFGGSPTGRGESGRPLLLGPLVTGRPRRVAVAARAGVVIPPLRVGAPSEASRSTAQSFTSPPEEDSGWRDESPGFSFGEAEPEDELALLDDGGSIVAAAGPAILPSLRRTGLVDLPDPARLEEIADRLEGIARILREQGSAVPLLGQGSDPLGALITGYLVGYFEGSGSRSGNPAG